MVWLVAKKEGKLHHMFIQNMINRSVVVTQKRIEKAMLLLIAKYCHVSDGNYIFLIMPHIYMYIFIYIYNLIGIYLIHELIPIHFEVTYQWTNTWPPLKRAECMKSFVWLKNWLKSCLGESAAERMRYFFS